MWPQTWTISKGMGPTCDTGKGDTGKGHMHG